MPGELLSQKETLDWFVFKPTEESYPPILNIYSNKTMIFDNNSLSLKYLRASPIIAIAALPSTSTSSSRSAPSTSSHRHRRLQPWTVEEFHWSLLRLSLLNTAQISHPEPSLPSEIHFSCSCRTLAALDAPQRSKQLALTTGGLSTSCEVDVSSSTRKTKQPLPGSSLSSLDAPPRGSINYHPCWCCITNEAAGAAIVIHDVEYPSNTTLSPHFHIGENDWRTPPLTTKVRRASTITIVMHEREQCLRTHRKEEDACNNELPHDTTSSMDLDETLPIHMNRSLHCRWRRSQSPSMKVMTDPHAFCFINALGKMNKVTGRWEHTNGLDLKTETSTTVFFTPYVHVQS